MRRSGEARAFVTAFCAMFLLLLSDLAAATAVFSLPIESKQEIRCLIFIDGSQSGYKDRILALFDDANKYLEQEDVEIRLVPCATSRLIEFKGDTPRKMLNELRRAAAHSADAWDLAVAFTTGPLQGPNGENWSGVIEKRQSKHIIIKYLNRNTLLHEIGHALGLPHGSGMMLPTVKTNYVHLEEEYRDALKTARMGAPGRTVAVYTRDADNVGTQRGPTFSLRFAKAGDHN